MWKTALSAAAPTSPQFSGCAPVAMMTAATGASRSAESP